MPIPSKSLLLAFDFHLPAPSGTQEDILFIHSSPPDQSEVSLSRLTKLYSDKKFSLLKKKGAPFPENDLHSIQTQTYNEPHLPPEFNAQSWKTQSLESKFGLVFFCVNMEVKVSMKMDKPDASVEEVEYEKVEDKLKFRYGNILDFLENSGLKEVSYVIDKNFRVWKLTHRDMEAWSAKWEFDGESLLLPLTLLSHGERSKLYNLGRNGPAEGAIVNIGNFLGGSSIILSKGSKKEHREKVYTFDPKQYPLKENYFKKNQVEDWIVFNQLNSEDGARDWEERRDKRIRLLFIDGDHSYEQCHKDITLWSRYLVPGGVIALHDYSRANCDGNVFGVTRAAYETLICNEGYHEFRREDYLFMANKV